MVTCLYYQSGMLEYWDKSGNKPSLIVKNSFKPIIPLLHYSIIPIGAKPLSFTDGYFISIIIAVSSQSGNFTHMIQSAQIFNGSSDLSIFINPNFLKNSSR